MSYEPGDEGQLLPGIGLRDHLAVSAGLAHRGPRYPARPQTKRHQPPYRYEGLDVHPDVPRSGWNGARQRLGNGLL
jgi:hypothetical protein